MDIATHGLQSGAVLHLYQPVTLFYHRPGAFGRGVLYLLHIFLAFLIECRQRFQKRITEPIDDLDPPSGEHQNSVNEVQEHFICHIAGLEKLRRCLRCLMQFGCLGLFQNCKLILYRVLCEYYHLLRDWKERYAPQPTDEDWHPLFCEALQKIDYVEYLLDELISGTLEERTAIVKEKEKDLAGLEKKIAAFSGGGKDDPQRGRIWERGRNARYPEELAM